MKSILLAITLFMCSFQIFAVNIGTYTLSNRYLSRTISVEKGNVFTSKLENKLAQKIIVPLNHIEFQLSVAQTQQGKWRDEVLTSKAFTLKKVIANTKDSLVFLLENNTYKLTVELVYTLKPNDVFIHKFLRIKPKADVVLRRADLEVVKLDDIYQPYQIKQITSVGPSKWRPGLGQPLYTAQSATFWGVEFPASNNYVTDQTAYCGYLNGRTIKSGKSYTTYQSVFGVGDDAKYIQDAFFDYIDKIRIRPLRLQIQYNSWFDFSNSVTQDKFSKSVSTVNQELCVKRGVAPLSAYVIDDGWQNAKIDWSNKAWKVDTSRFNADFKSSFDLVNKAHSKLGLWLSPGSVFGGQPAVPIMREKGIDKALDKWMSMADSKYMDLLEDRMLELTKQGVSYFKLDGIFGHLNTREFDLNTERYGVASIPGLDVSGFKPSDERLNEQKYDDLKTLYLVAGTERLMKIFAKQHTVNPKIYTVISNGAYLSPWWLQYIDAVWMINAGDAASGTSRNEELNYRDGVYYNTWVKEKTQYPINSIFNHEPKKTSTGETVEIFSQYLFMNLSRGTGFIELYLKTEKLLDADWDVLASGLKWARNNFQYFKKSKMHGGSPAEGKVYGYTGWNEKGGYISVHNPSSSVTQTYTVALNRALGLNVKLGKLKMSSPLNNAAEFVGQTVSAGDEISFQLKPGEVKVLNFMNVPEQR